jgi:hypothetical protein
MVILLLRAVTKAGSILTSVASATVRLRLPALPAAAVVVVAATVVVVAAVVVAVVATAVVVVVATTAVVVALGVAVAASPQAANISSSAKLTTVNNTTLRNFVMFLSPHDTCKHKLAYDQKSSSVLLIDKTGCTAKNLGGRVLSVRCLLVKEMRRLYMVT